MNRAAWLPITHPRAILPLMREGFLAAFFVALAVSISATQILLTLLFLLMLPWNDLVQTRGAPTRLAALAREIGAGLQPFRRNPLTPPLLMLVGLTILSALLSGNAGWSLWIARDTLRIGAFYLVLWYTRDSMHAARLWQGFLVVLTLMACYGVVQAYICTAQPDVLTRAWLDEICRHPERVRGPFSIYMTFGGVLLLGSLFFVAHLANVPWRRVWWMVPASAVSLVALALTYSRNAWLGFAAGTLGLVVTARQAARAALILVTLVLLVTVASPHGVIDRIRSLGNLEDPTIRDRFAMWQSGLAMIEDHPFLGVGPGQVSAWYPHYRRPEALRTRTSHLHNSPIHIAAERGLPALAVWVWLWVVFFREGGRILVRLGRDRPLERALVCGSLGGVGGFLVAGLFEHNFGDGEVVLLVYAAMGLPFIIQRQMASTRTVVGPPH